MSFTVKFSDGTTCGHNHRKEAAAQGCLKRSKREGEVVDFETPDTEKTRSNAKKFSVSRRFEILETIAGMTCRGSQRAIFIGGNGGTGKSYTIFNEIERHGMTKTEVSLSSDDDEVQVSDTTKHYIKVSGASSPLGLYRTLYENSNALIVFDDCDGFLNNDNAVNILKAVLDTSGDGTVTWNSPIVERMGLPTSFQFQGRVVFISNKEVSKIPQPILSRSLILDMTLDKTEIVERARDLGEFLLPNLNEEQRVSLFDFVEENYNEFRDVSLRTFVLAEPYISEGRNDWRDLLMFTS